MRVSMMSRLRYAHQLTTVFFMTDSRPARADEESLADVAPWRPAAMRIQGAMRARLMTRRRLLAAIRLQGAARGRADRQVVHDAKKAR